MSESGNKHQDRLIENALALLQEAVRKEPFDVKDFLPPAQFGSAETNVVVTKREPDGYTSVVAASSVAIVVGHEPEQQRASPPSPDLEHQPEEAAAPEPTDIVERTLSIMRAASEELKAASSSSVMEGAANCPVQKAG
jgi:hypothetical protein